MAIPFYKQETKYTCGAAAMRMALEHVGINKSEKQLIRLLRTNKVIGTWSKAFPLLAEKYRLVYTVKRKSSIRDLKEYQKKGFAIIICYFYAPEKVGHFSVLKRIDKKFIYFLDPQFGPKHRYPLSYFKKIWKSSYDKEKGWFFALKKP